MGDMVKALNAADIECPIYISVQWDERNARLHPEWRVMAADNRYHRDNPDDPSAGKQLSPAWHTLCLNHKAYRDELLEQAREVCATTIRPASSSTSSSRPIASAPNASARCRSTGSIPRSRPTGCKNDEWVNERFRQEMSAALRDEFPGVRIFYNCGHIHKQGPQALLVLQPPRAREPADRRLGLRPLPVERPLRGDARASTSSPTPASSTPRWGEFGGFKHPDALEFEAAQMVALGSKCLVGDQLHPDGRINPDTYASIAPAYRRIEKLEPYLEDAPGR